MTEQFPSPLEGWVGSYLIQFLVMGLLIVSFRPLSRVGWVPTIQ